VRDNVSFVHQVCKPITRRRTTRSAAGGGHIKVENYGEIGTIVNGVAVVRERER
jgi:hypothetical protein